MIFILIKGLWLKETSVSSLKIAYHGVVKTQPCVKFSAKGSLAVNNNAVLNPYIYALKKIVF